MASIRDFVFGFRLEVIDHLSGVLKNVETRIEGINAAAARGSHLREASATLGKIGLAGIAAGGGLAYGLGKITESAMKGDDATRHMMTAFDLSVPAAQQTKHLAETLKMVKEASQATGMSQDALKDSVYNAKMMMLSDADANAVAAASAKLAIGTTHDFAEAQANVADVSAMLATTQNVLGGSVSALSDKFALLQSHYGFERLPDLKAAWDYILPSIKAVKLAQDDAMAAMAVLSTSGYQKDRIGTAMEEVVAKITTGKAALRSLVVANKEGGPDLEKTSERLAGITAAMSALQRASYLKTLGFNLRDVQVMETLIDGVKKFHAARADLANSKGATDALFNIRSQGADEKWGQLQNNLSILSETLGNSLLPSVTKVVSKLNTAVIAVTEFAESYKPFVKVAMTVAAISSAVLLVGGGLALASSALLGFVSFVPALKEVSAAFKLGAAVTKIWTAAQWALDAAMAVGVAPIVLTIAAVAALGVAIYEVYKHWAAIKNFGKEMYDAGMNIVKAIGSGIAAGAMYPVHAIEHALSLVRAHLPFSPAKIGPLRDLNRVRIVETIADSMKPAAMVTSMRRVAAIVAFSAPMMATPAFAGGFARASAGGGSSIVINITQNITIKPGADAGEVLAVMRASGRELADTLRREMEHDERRHY